MHQCLFVVCSKANDQILLTWTGIVKYIVNTNLALDNTIAKTLFLLSVIIIIHGGLKVLFKMKF